TVKHRRFQIQMMASALVRQGHRREDITSLAYLVDLQNFRDGLRYLMSRHNGNPTEAIHTLAVGLKGIARHHVKVGQEHLDEMFRICKGLNSEVDGLREKNRDRLSQLEDDHSLARLIHLPAELLRASKRQGIRLHKAALLMQAAVAIEILLYAPMRIGNLTALDLERHIRRIQVGREKRTQIMIPGDEVKNGKPLDYELGPKTTRLLDTYIEEARPVLLRKPSDYLFPAQEGGHKRPTALSTLIKSTILEYTGLDITAHLFRSIAVKLHSRVAPGDYVTLSHVLSDTLSTTMKAYAPFEQKASLEHYQRSVDKARSQLPSGRKIRRSGR
ncbi:tyrosine-type recombinase/integrase, partial [Nitrospinota bacterium]